MSLNYDYISYNKLTPVKKHDFSKLEVNKLQEKLVDAGVVLHEKDIF